GPRKVPNAERPRARTRICPEPVEVVRVITTMKWRSGLLLLGVLVAAACTGPTASASHSPTPQAPSPSPIPTPVASPSPIFDSPSPLPPSPTPLSATLKCRLPISNGQPGSGGFIVFPSAKFVSDPTSNVVIHGIPSPSPGPY